MVSHPDSVEAEKVDLSQVERATVSKPLNLFDLPPTPRAFLVFTFYTTVLNSSFTQSEDTNDVASEFTPKQQKSIIHRVDRRLVTTLGVLYCCSLMDRTNLSSANIAG